MVCATQDTATESARSTWVLRSRVPRCQVGQESPAHYPANNIDNLFNFIWLALCNLHSGIQLQHALTKGESASYRMDWLGCLHLPLDAEFCILDMQVPSPELRPQY